MTNTKRNLLKQKQKFSYISRKIIQGFLKELTTNIESLYTNKKRPTYTTISIASITLLSFTFKKILIPILEANLLIYFFSTTSERLVQVAKLRLPRAIPSMLQLTNPIARDFHISKRTLEAFDKWILILNFLIKTKSSILIFITPLNRPNYTNP